MSRKTGKRTIPRPLRDVTEQLDPFPAKTRPRNKNGAIFKPSLKHRKSRIQPNQKIFSLEHFRKKVDLFRRIKKSTVRCTLMYRTQSTVGKRWWLYILPQYPANQAANSHFFWAKFVPVLTTLCMLRLKLLELFCAFL